jgi:cytochrome c oxidase subunit IV
MCINVFFLNPVNKFTFYKKKLGLLSVPWSLLIILTTVRLLVDIFPCQLFSLPYLLKCILVFHSLIAFLLCNL